METKEETRKAVRRQQDRRKDRTVEVRVGTLNTRTKAGKGSALAAKKDKTETVWTCAWEGQWIQWTKDVED